ncbi:hypothetical protein M422DRAFT_54466 [Sphaerobolus stellatus SS14]|uniref:Uncharacterized protein n=1 Tax=Sphaerobolus stellatus (strain SS14) TaxID=990650 RepID=A0A0C9U3R0_SPHS4|nr:hypothetical protein M422DRAFT_54466 [Sphaerobolus stellatus SS14]
MSKPPTPNNVSPIIPPITPPANAIAPVWELLSLDEDIPVLDPEKTVGERLEILVDDATVLLDDVAVDDVDLLLDSDYVAVLVVDVAILVDGVMVLIDGVAVLTDSVVVLIDDMAVGINDTVVLVDDTGIVILVVDVVVLDEVVEAGTVIGAVGFDVKSDSVHMMYQCRLWSV